MQNISNLGRRAGLIGLAVRDRIRDDRGEGIISMAIAILVIASVGAVMWGIFNAAAEDLGDRTNEAIEGIGG